MQQSKVLVIVGPTASGKTSLAIDLAKQFDGEIICADSRTIYQGMDIGTAKPTIKQQDGIKHHLLDIVKPDEVFSASDFKIACLQAIKDIKEKHKLPIICGGSGLYIDSVLYDYNFRSKKHTEHKLDGYTQEQIKDLARSLYPKEYELIDNQNMLRVIQLIERGPVNNDDRKVIKLNCKIIGLSPERLTIKRNIALRTKEMLSNGFVQEVQSLLDMYGAKCPAMSTIGYKQIGDMIMHQTDLNDVENTINKATMDYAKRQLTWFRRNNSIVWAENHTKAIEIAKEYLQSI